MIVKEETKLSLFIIIIISTTSIFLVRAHHDYNNSTIQCKKSCGNGKSIKWVPYPFGFSNGCGIQLHCIQETGGIEIGEFQVQNITPNAIFVYLPANCNRSLDSVRPLFGHRFAPAWRNGLLLQNCTRSLSSCVIPTSSFSNQLDIPNCNPRSDNISCYSRDKLGMDVLSYDDLNSTECKFLFSSFAVWSNDPSVSLELERVELDWWLEGSCGVDQKNCSKNANCTDVKLSDGKGGFRCRCQEGFTGDGFRNGDGCRSVSSCNASKYINGQCGGTTRVGVLVGGIIAGASLMAGLALICYFVRRRSNSWRNRLSAKRLLCEAAGNSSVPFYPYREIEKATNGFSDKQRLGTGAYGTVYAGKLHNEEWVAIKRIRHRDTDSIDQVMNEIKLLSSVSHPNLVRLLGCCIEEGEPILVYEFMPNGTLCQHLQRERGKGIPWTIRLTIAAETSNAIAYLHSAMNPPIYHRDIKSSNILLDYNYKSKVADFGLSRLGMTESSHISTAPQGTPGYLDPQYHQYFHLSDKSDVYSFGVVLVEIITALKVVDFSRPHSEVNLAALAIDRIGRGCVDEIIDPYLDPNRDAWTLSSIHNVAELAFRCLAFHRDMRPTMIEVAEELENIRLSAWVPNMYSASPAASSCSSADNVSERSLSVNSIKKAGVVSRRLLVPQRPPDCLTSLEEVKDSSPVSVQDPWCSEQSSPSTNSLLGGYDETLSHVLFQCTVAAQVWYVSPLRINLVTMTLACFQCLFCDYMKHAPTRALEILSIMAWALWQNRNQIYFASSSGAAPYDICMKALNYLHEFQNAQVSQMSQVAAGSVNMRWSMQMTGMRKLDTDAALFRDGSIGYGFVVRDEEGQVLLAGSKRESLSGDSTVAEGLALRWALECVAESGSRHLSVECDSKLLVDAINDANQNHVASHLIVEDIKEIGVQVDVVGFNFAKRVLFQKM